MELVTLLRGKPGYLAAPEERLSDLQTRMATGEIPMGRMVRRSGVGQVDLPGSSTDEMQGVAVFDEKFIEAKYPEKFETLIISKGPVFGDPDGRLDYGQPVFVRFRVDPHVFLITVTGDFEAGNRINGGVGSGSIPEMLFSASHLETLLLLADAISNLQDVGRTEIITDHSIRITARNAGEQINAAFFVIEGAAQPVIDVSTVSGPSNGTKLGGFRMDADDTGAGPSAVFVPRVQCLKSGSDQEAPLIELNLTP